ncbi:MAG: ABC transporter ATP-binding protein [Deltaproteobacteria bacterium]|nr:ABC transporter ATP-binding protein [Deltaproteobacteria bacterium]MBW1915167.1 ABC transporter ATP-binding protein [Deltaproteobacteria bacterium]
MLLEIKNLKVNYDRAQALKGVSINIQEGEIVTLIGANGAGKTTTLRTISGLKQPLSGEIFFEGRQISGIPAYKIARRGIAHCPEGRMVFAPMTVLENLNMGAYQRKDKKKIGEDLEHIYELFPVLKERLNQQAGSLSGGEQQMLSIARGLMIRPKLLLLDEPSLGLSPIYVEQVSEIIKNINKEKVSIMLVEQNAHLGLNLADRAYVLELGEISIEGDAEKLVNNESVKAAYLCA